MEHWKPIKDYEGIYEVSDLGKVRSSLNKTTQSTLHGKRVWKQRILKQKTDSKGYKRVTLWKNKASKGFLVHRLVAISFIENKDKKKYVNHKDGNPSNNYVSNLEWCTSSENLIHAFENRLNQNPDPIVLYNNNTGELKYFRSKAEGSKFLGRNQGFLSGVMKKGESTIDEYEIYCKTSKEV